MSQIATREDFFGGRIASHYRRYDFFGTRADRIRALYPTAQTVLVAGCAFGFLVEALCERGLNAWGVEASAPAWSEAQKVLPSAIRHRIVKGDCADTGSMAKVARASIGSGHRFDLCVTEDLLVACEDDAEVSRMLTALRSISVNVLHWVSCLPEQEDRIYGERIPEWLWKTGAEWQALVQPDRLFDETTKEVL